MSEPVETNTSIEKEMDPERAERIRVEKERIHKAVNNRFRATHCGCHTSFAHLLDEWLSEGEDRVFRTEWRTYNGVEKFYVQIFANNSWHNATYTETMWVTMADGSKMEVPKDEKFRKLFHKIIGDLCEHIERQAIHNEVVQYNYRKEMEHARTHRSARPTSPNA